jgi:hypothetical protein
VPAHLFRSASPCRHPQGKAPLSSSEARGTLIGALGGLGMPQVLHGFAGNSDSAADVSAALQQGQA